MVIGTERTNWHSQHPPACTCEDCTNKAADQRRFQEQYGNLKVGRNDLCPCGSGKKFKKCHGG